MKKKILSTLLCSMMLAGATSYAAVPTSQMVLGGIENGASIQEVEATCGKPDRIESKTKPAGEKVEYEYGHNLDVKFLNGKVYEVEVSHNSNAKTAAGIGIGATAKDVEAAYGAPDRIHGDKYIYYVEGDHSRGLVFEFKSGQVKEIECGSID